MPSLPQRKLSQDPIFPNLLGGDRVVILRTPQDEPDITKRNGTASQETLAAAISKLLPGNIIRVDIPGANQLLANNAPDPQVQEAAWYTIDGDWDQTGNDTRVFVWGLSTEAFSPVGILRDALGAYSFVQVHVPTATTTPFTGGGGGGTIDAYTKAQTDILLGFKLNADKLGQSLTRTDAIAAIAPHNGLTAGASYIVTGTWNGIPNSGVALLAGSIDNFNPVGYVTISNNAVAVVADVKAGTYQLLSDLLGGANLTQVDLLNLTGTQMDEVIALTYTNGDAPLASTPGWSKPGMWFDALLSGTAYRFTCGRGNYTPGTTGSGVGPRWSRISKD